MKKFLHAVVLVLYWAAGKVGCALGQSSPEHLTKSDVEQVIAQAASHAAAMNQASVIAVTDREGFVLGVWDLQGRLPSVLPSFSLEIASVLRTYGLLAGAVTRAGTAAFLSSDQAALTTRTAGYVTQQHFPPGAINTPPGPLVGVGFSNLFFSDINRFKQLTNPLFPAASFEAGDLRASLSPGNAMRISPGIRGAIILPGSLNDSPGGVPLYKNGHLVGGIGVTGDGIPTDLAPAAAIFLSEVQLFATTGYLATTQADFDEFIALAGQANFRPSPAIVATNIFVNGIRFPYVFPAVGDIPENPPAPPLSSIPGRVHPHFPIQPPPPPFPYPVMQLGGVTGELRGPVVTDSPADSGGVIRFIDDPLAADPGRTKVGGARRLVASEVQSIITKAAQRAAITRAGIRLPLGSTAQTFIAVVNNPDKDLEPATVLGTFRVGEATLFSWDVAVQKARSAVFCSNHQLAMSTRSAGFLAQRYFPPGIDGTAFGPLFGFQEAVSLKRRAGTELSANVFPGNPNLPNGLTIFPGGFPLYRDGRLIGAIGVSGDGVDQDDIIAASGCEDFLPPASIRADTFAYGGFRLPYAKFPRNPVAASLVRNASRVTNPVERDVSGDGKADLIFQNSTGQIYLWKMNGAGVQASGGFFYQPPLRDWRVQAIADLDHNGHTDFLFQNSAGHVVAWYRSTDGNEFTAKTIYNEPLGEWRTVAAGDLNDDGFADLVFQNGEGRVFVWHLDAHGAVRSSGWLYSEPLPGWKVVGLADLNNDKAADFIFQHSSGTIVVWFLNHTGGFVSRATISEGPLGDWRVACVADMNGDAKPDLIFQNGVGQIAVWFLNWSGGQLNFAAGISVLPESRMIYPDGLGDWRVR